MIASEMLFFSSPLLAIAPCNSPHSTEYGVLGYRPAKSRFQSSAVCIVAARVEQACTSSYHGACAPAGHPLADRIGFMDVDDVLYE